MKLDDIPQQADEIYEGETKIVYATNSSGKLQPASTSGWSVEVDVLKDAIDEISAQANEAYARVIAGQSSPLEYFMYAKRMDLPMLAQAVKKFQWQVRRHFHPVRFAKLSSRVLETYASVLDIKIVELKEFSAQSPDRESNEQY